LTALMPALRASIEGSTAGHTVARLMQPDTAMAHITAIALRTIPATTRCAAVLEAIPYAPPRLPIPHPATAITCHPLRPYSPTIPECLEPRTARTGPAQSAMHTACTSAGRPKGSRNKLSEDFLADFLEAWTTHGKQALEEMATKNPTVFVRVAASLIPPHFKVEPDHTLVLTADELRAKLIEIRTKLLDSDIDPELLGPPAEGNVGRE